jgi:hypothetical protein
MEPSLASRTLERAGVRLIHLDGAISIGVWSDLDRPEIRLAIRAFGSGRLPVRYLDGNGIPTRYKSRQVEGEPVPLNVLAEMEKYPNDCWIVRDKILKEIGWYFREGGQGGTSTRVRFKSWRQTSS